MGIIHLQSVLIGSKQFLGSSSSTIAGNFEDTSQITAKAKRLADLFRPPFDIMFKGGFEEVR